MSADRSIPDDIKIGGLVLQFSLQFINIFKVFIRPFIENNIQNLIKDVSFFILS